MKFQSYSDIVALGIEPARAEALTNPGSAPITIADGQVFWDLNCEPVGSVEFFVSDVNSEPFDYESGEFI